VLNFMAEEPISVDCKVTGQKFDFDYDTENTLHAFISDLQAEQPAMGFEVMKAMKSGSNDGIFVDGNAYPFCDNHGSTLASLGVTTNSVIIVSNDVTQA